MIRRYLSLVSVALLCSAVPVLPQAQALAQDDADRCPAGGSGCTLDNAAERIWDRVVEGAEAVIEDTNPEGRVDEVGDTVEDCMQCGMDAIDDAFGSDDSEPSDSSDSSDDGDSGDDSFEIATDDPEAI